MNNKKLGVIHRTTCPEGAEKRTSFCDYFTDNIWYDSVLFEKINIYNCLKLNVRKVIVYKKKEIKEILEIMYFHDFFDFLFKTATAVATPENSCLRVSLSPENCRAYIFIVSSKKH